MKKLLSLLVALLIVVNIAPARPQGGKPGRNPPLPPPISTRDILPHHGNG